MTMPLERNAPLANSSYDNGYQTRTRLGRSRSHSYCGHQGVTRMIVSRTLWNPVQCSERELVSNQRLREPSSGTPVLSEIAAMLLLSDRALGNKAAAASTPSLLARM